MQRLKIEPKIKTVLISLLVILTALVVQPISATQNYWYEVFTCEERPIPEGVEIIPLSGAELHKTIAQALENDMVNTLKDALLHDGYTPEVNDASANIAVDEETGSVNGFTVVIPFRGDSVYAAIYFFHSYLEDFDQVVASVAYRFEEQVNVDIYKINDEGDVDITTLHDHSCTWDCMAECCENAGLSPLAVVACISACITCYMTGLPACLVCATCGGIVIGCAIGCCL